MIVMPPMARGQEAAWHGVLDLYDAHPTGWTLVGGQLVHLHCAERGFTPPRPTDDADAVVNARRPAVLGSVTNTLTRLGFVAAPASAHGIQHRWSRGLAIIDVLIPDGMGERAERRPSSTGLPTIAAPGGTQALGRSEVVEVRVGDRAGSVPRPNLIGALILKAKARVDTTASERDRHCEDFAVLAAMLAATDVRGLHLTRGERASLRAMIGLTRSSERSIRTVPDVVNRLNRLADIIG